MSALKNRVNQAMGREPADLVIKNVSLLNVADGSIRETDIAVTGNTITGIYSDYESKTTIDGKGLFAVPGFIDSHVHIESSQITPGEFDRCMLPQGTTTAICDPHEISNVLGMDGLEYVIRSSEHTIMDVMVGLSSCVPATDLETSGARLEADDLRIFKDHPNVVGLAEFMNIGGVLGLQDDVFAKLDGWADGHIDGHMPGITGVLVNAMASCGICNCHESISAEEAADKLSRGIQIFIREGSVTKNAGEIGKILTPFNSPWMGLCTDDRSPMDVAKEGHIDHVIRKTLATGADLTSVYRAASWSAAQGFGLHKNTPKWQKRGLIAPGFKADIVLLNSLETCDVHSVIKNGKLVTPESFEGRTLPKPVGYNSVKLDKVKPSDFIIKAEGRFENTEVNPVLNVIGIIPGDIVTTHLQVPMKPDASGVIATDIHQDILKLAVLERHGKNGNIAKAFIQGFGFKDGAIASSVGHDSHNVTVVGATDEDMAVAVNRIRELQGGYVVVKDQKVIGEFALPVAGLMSDKPFEEAREDIKALREAAAKLNSNLEEPFMMTGFMALCVIPTVKLTDFGLVRFDPASGDEGPVLIEDQRHQPLLPPGVEM